MNQENLTPADEEIIAQLTSYLDGELDEVQVRSVEEQISTDAKYQSLLRQLQQTWDVLDVLPSAEISKSRDFTQSTMKLVVQDAKKLTQKSSGGFWKWPFRVFALCLVPCFASAGTYITGRYLQHSPIRLLESNLSVIRNVDVYTFDKNLSVEFLEALADEGDLFGDAIMPMPADQIALAMTDDEMLDQFESLDEPQKQRIRVNFQRFRNLSAVDEGRIKNLHAQISKHPRSVELLKAMHGYHAWLSTLWETQTAEILDTVSTPDRIRLIKDIAWQEYELSERDKQSIFRDVLDIVSNKQKDLDGMVSSINPLILLEIAMDSQKPMLDAKNARKLQFLYDEAPEKLDELFTRDDIRKIKEPLSYEVMYVIDLTIDWTGNSDKSEAQLLVQWMIEVSNAKFPPKDAPQNIEEVYENLKGDERDRIDNQHPTDRKRMLLKIWEESNRH